MKTVGYTRVSTAAQAEEGVSLEAQRRKIEAYCALHELELTEIIEDRGLSGKTIAARPGFLHVLDLVKSRKIQHVVIFKLDRMARNLKEACEIAELLEKKKVSLHSISERIDSGSATGRLFYNILSAMAAWEREIISERTIAAMAVKREKGERISGRAPFGYAFDAAGKLISEPKEQEVIGHIRTLKAQGYTLHGMIRFLDEHGYRNRKGNIFGVTETWKIAKAA